MGTFPVPVFAMVTGVYVVPQNILRVSAWEAARVLPLPHCHLRSLTPGRGAVVQEHRLPSAEGLPLAQSASSLTSPS